jgi:hypothetical protein
LDEQRKREEKENKKRLDDQKSEGVDELRKIFGGAVGANEEI